MGTFGARSRAGDVDGWDAHRRHVHHSARACAGTAHRARGGVCRGRPHAADVHRSHADGRYDDGQGCAPAGTPHGASGLVGFIVDGAAVLSSRCDRLGARRDGCDRRGGASARLHAVRGGVVAGVGLDTRRFAGKERDAETGFDYFSARYYAAGIGRFGSRDPISVNAVRMTDGQRWNAFSYAINNPLKYGDPDGRDALLVFYTQGAMLAGHVGVMALNRDGSGTYGGFNPVTKGKLWDQGDVDLHPIPPGFISLNSSGMPTTDSLDRLRRYLRGSEGDGKPSGSYFIKHIKTSDAQTLALSAYIARTNAQPWRYNVMWTNCLDFAYKGLSEAGIDVPKPRLLEAPNNYALRSFGLDFVRWSFNRFLGAQGNVTTSWCINGVTCR